MRGGGGRGGRNDYGDNKEETFQGTEKDRRKIERAREGGSAKTKGAGEP